MPEEAGQLWSRHRAQKEAVVSSLRRDTRSRLAFWTPKDVRGLPAEAPTLRHSHGAQGPLVWRMWQEPWCDPCRQHVRGLWSQAGRLRSTGVEEATLVRNLWSEARRCRCSQPPLRQQAEGPSAQWGSRDQAPSAYTGVVHGEREEACYCQPFSNRNERLEWRGTNCSTHRHTCSTCSGCADSPTRRSSDNVSEVPITGRIAACVAGCSAGWSPDYLAA